VIGIDSPEEAIEYIQSQERPLAMYWFGKNKKVLHDLLQKTHAGGVTVNDTLLHFTLEELPFGGIGPSGMGNYHGLFGFNTFSHHKPVLETKGFLGIRKWMGTSLAHPPYGKTIERLIRRLGSK
jgi:coniferyl-aldehyde dehydrogenase